MSIHGSVVRNEPCPRCGSRDNIARHEDGYAKCYSIDCGYYEMPDGHAPQEARKVSKDRDNMIRDWHIQELPKRRLEEATLEKWKYGVAEYKGKAAQVANYFRDGVIVAQKVRFANKDFTFLGEPKQSGLYGQWLWGDGGKYLCITEGEIDALSVSQLFNLKYPVVSVPNGAQGAARSIKAELEWVNKYDSIVLMFDNDEPGQKAAKEVAELLPPGKVKIARLPLKDANEMLTTGRGGEVVRAFWDAKTYRPDGLICGTDTWELVSQRTPVYTVQYPWQGMNTLTHGLRAGEIVTLTAGSGIGKSTIAREIALHLVKMGETIGYIGLEESIKQSTLLFMGLEASRRLHISMDDVTPEEMRSAWEATMGTGRIFLYDHWGSTEIDNLMEKVRYLARGYDCKYIFLDHLSIVVSGLETDNERRLIDETMTKLRTLVEETGVGVVLVSHLKRPPDGRKGHEEGAQTSLSHLRGSHAIAQLSDIVVGIERNQQGKHPSAMTVRVLKNRFSGETGVAGWLDYSQETGRTFEIDDPTKEFPDDNTQEDF
jgi:twinkle protein